MKQIEHHIFSIFSNLFIGHDKNYNQAVGTNRD